MVSSYGEQVICVLKLDPGTEVTEGLLSAYRRLGWDRAIILSGMGSVREAHLEYQSPTGRAYLTVAGPGLEIASISGRLDIEAGSAEQPVLSAVVCDQFGASFGGRLRRGKNFVCITLEVIAIKV